MDFILQGVAQAIILLASGDWETYSAVFATMHVSALSMGASLLIGIPLGYLLGYLDFPGKKPLRTVVDTLLSLPTVFIGLVVYAFLSYRGPLGELGLLFTLTGIAIGQTILALPVVIALTATAVESMDANLRVTLLSLGAKQAAVTLPLLVWVYFRYLSVFGKGKGQCLLPADERTGPPGGQKSR